MTTRPATSRRGITLMEVLISIGILAIGLSSVVAILPAAKSQATRAVVLDRASGLAANLLADAATFGLLREGSLHPAPGPGVLAIVDPSLDSTIASGAYPFAIQPWLKKAGVYSAVTATETASEPFHKLFTEARDDILLGDPPTPDELPTHSFVDGARAYQGRMTALLAVRPPAPLATPPTPGLVSAVVFHNRDISQPIVTGLLNGVQLTLPTIPAGRTFRDLVKPGVVIYDGTRFHRVTSAAVHEVGGAISAFVTLSKPPPYGSAISLFPDSVGLAERPYTPEVNGAFLR